MRRLANTIALLTLALFVVTIAVIPVDAGGAKRVKGTDLDRAVIRVDTIPTDLPVVMLRFDTENAELGTGAKENKVVYQRIAREMQTEAPEILAEVFVRELTQQGIFPEVIDAGAASEGEEGTPLPENALIVEGAFTTLNPGSKGKRYFVSMGAGKSKVCLEGTVKDAEGEVLAEFQHCRSQGIGMFGGDSKNQMMKDVNQTAIRLAGFVAEWAQGKYAK